MKGSLHWWTLIVGYLLGSFFGLARVFGLFQPKAPAPAPAA